MTRDIALRLDAMLMHARGGIDMVAYYMKNNLSEDEFRKYIGFIGSSMAELIEISNDLHSKYPDIIPDELK
jgi:hypothetical protein